MVIKFTLKLQDTASPHLYVHQLKELMKADDYIHPLMKNTLLLMKKTRMPYVRLATLKELILIPEKFLHLERALEPIITGWVRVDWTEEEKLQYKTSPDAFIKELLSLYDRLGYLMSKSEISESEADNILSLIKPEEFKK